MLLLASLSWAASRLVFVTDTPVSPMLDGAPLTYRTGTLEAVAEEVPEGLHTLALGGQDGRLVYAAEVDVPDHAEVKLRWQKGRFSVVSTTALPVRAATARDVTARYRGAGAPWAGMTVSVPGVTVVVNGMPVPGSPPPPPAQPDPPSVVTFTATDWANVRVDGDLLELRNDHSASVTLPAGPHTVEVRDFMDNEVWAKGTLLVSGGGTIKIGVVKGGAPEIYNRQGAWTAR